MFLCFAYRQVSTRRPVPLSNRLKRLSGSKLHHVVKAQSCIRARAATVSTGSRTRAPLRGVAHVVSPLSSLRRTSARLKMLERRTTARFLHVSPRRAGAPSQQLSSDPKHSSPTLAPGKLYLSPKGMDLGNDHQIGRSETTPRVRHLPSSDQQQELYLKYIHTAVDDQSKVRHSARLFDASRSSHFDKEDTDDVSRTFIHQRFSQRRSEDDGQNFQTAGKPEKMTWHSAVLRRSDDGGFGRFVIRRSRPQLTCATESGRRSCRSVDIYGSKYSSPAAMQAVHSAALPSSAASSDFRLVKAEYVPPTVEKPGGDERLLYTALSRSTVGFRWLESVS